MGSAYSGMRDFIGWLTIVAWISCGVGLLVAAGMDDLGVFMSSVAGAFAVTAFWLLARTVTDIADILIARR